jgi:hypothetical protein
MELTCRDDIVTQENVHGAMSCDFHRGRLIDAGVDQVSDG